MKRASPAQGGFAYIAAVIVVVVLAMLATAAVRMYTTQQATVNQDLLSAQAWQAARAGNEWGLYQALRLGNCGNAVLNLTADNGFLVNVSCTQNTYEVGQDATGQPIRNTIFQIDALACNSGTACPDPNIVNTAEYTERRRIVTACLQPGGIDC
jgi:type II secretory pathway pseudopilin PulG